MSVTDTQWRVAVAEAATKCGGRQELAYRIGVSIRTVDRWLDDGIRPRSSALQDHVIDLAHNSKPQFRLVCSRCGATVILE